MVRKLGIPKNKETSHINSVRLLISFLWVSPYLNPLQSGSKCTPGDVELLQILSTVTIDILIFTDDMQIVIV